MLERREEMKNESSIAIYFWLLLVPLFWGGAFVAAEHVIAEIPPITAAAFRFGSAGIILLIIVLLQKNIDIRAVKKQWLPILFMALTGIFGYNLFFFIALDITSSINGSLIVATTPVLITLGAVMFLGEKGNKRLILGLALSLTGVIVVISKGSVQTLLQLQFNAGDVLFLFALVCWVAHGLLGKIVMRDVSPILTTTLTTLLGSIFLGLGSLYENSWHLLPAMSGQAWAEMLFMIVCSSVVGFFLWNHGIKQIGASKASIYMNLVPICTALIAVFLYGAAFTFVQLSGMMLVLLGVYLVTLHPYLINKRAKIKMVNMKSS
jgi:drug/metabolite transporter (DMT)-like permease